MKNKIKRVAAFFLAFVMIAATGDDLWGIQAQGAETGDITVDLSLDDGASTPTKNMKCLVGDYVQLKINPSEGRLANTATVTRVDGGKHEDIKQVFNNPDKTTVYAGRDFQIRINDKVIDANGNPTVEEPVGDYNISYNLFASKKGGYVTETLPKISGQPDREFSGEFSLDYNESIDTVSKLSFTCTSLSTKKEPFFTIVAGSGEGLFKTVTGVTYAGKATIDGKERLKIQIIASGSSASFVYVESHQDVIDVGTTFTLTFAQELTTSVTVSVVSPQQMVDDLLGGISGEGAKDIYIELNKGDKPQAIGSDNFKLLVESKGVQNSITDVKWYWVPYKDAGESDESYNNKKNVLAIDALNEPQGQDEKGKKKIAVRAAATPVTGYLYPVFTYQKTAGETFTSNPYATEEDLLKQLDGDKAKKPTTGAIEITIMGLGDLPTAVTHTQWVNTKTDPENGNGTPLLNTTLPNQIDMDHYDGSKNKIKKGTEPYRIKGSLNGGTQSKQCDRVVVSSDNPDAITFFTYNTNNEAISYAYGDPILFPSDVTGEQRIEYEIRTKEPPPDTGGAATNLKFEFYRTGLDTPMATATTRINVKNTSPNSNTKLSKLDMFAYKENSNLIQKFISMFAAESGGEIYEGFVFDKDQLIYPKPSDGKAELELRNTVEKIKFRPQCGNYGQKIEVATYDKTDKEILPKQEVLTEAYTPDIPLTVREPVKIVFTITAEDGSTTSEYVIKVVRKPPSEDAALKGIQAFPSAAPDAEELVLSPIFDSKTQKYEVRGVPYGIEKILIKAVPNDAGAIIQSIQADMPEDTAALDPTTNSKMVPLRYEQNEGAANNKTTVTIKILAEDKLASKSYVIDVYKDPPNANATLLELVITNEKGDVPYTLDPAFAAGAEPDAAPDTLSYSYTIAVPFEGNKVKIQAKPVYTGAKMILRQGVNEEALSPGTPSKAAKVEYATEQAPHYEMDVVVTAEDGKTIKTYQLLFVRTPPSKDASLSAIAAADKDGKAIAIAGFDPEVMAYSVEVPYTTDKIVVTPTPTYAKVNKITVNGKTVTDKKAAPPVKLAYPDKTTIEIVVTAEDASTTKTYTLTVTRKTPGKNARLKSLLVTGIVGKTLKPIFVPSKQTYTATVATGQKGVIITAVTDDKLASLTINGEKAVSGTPSPLIEIVEVQQTIDIVVTAEDGKTSTTYTITFTNDNLIEKSNNADLKSLKVQKGEMKPGFKASTTSYEVYVDEKTSDVDLFPVPADSLAKVQVFAASKEIGDTDGNYSQAIIDGENVFSIKVTSPDGKITKEYAVNIYRNEEGKMGSLAPLHADAIDYEASDIITVDITKQSRVAADVFEELKAYPEKKLVLQGNDYALQFDAKDLTKMIPSEMVYDFGMSFSSPNEDLILSEIASYSGNSDLKPVFLEFNYHGELPGKATFTISLGTRYANRKLYFHYYNEERDRLDYYGYVQTNSKGTFSTSLDRLGTFVITETRRLAGSENKALGNDTQAEGEDLGKTEDVTQNKINPNTGVRMGAIC